MVHHDRRRGGQYWAKSPMRFAQRIPVKLLLVLRGDFSWLQTIRWPGCPHFHPFDESRDLLVGQLLLGRHLDKFVANRFDEQTLIGVAGDNGGTAIPSCKQSSPAFDQ